jgi:hypothetical protein
LVTRYCYYFAKDPTKSRGSWADLIENPKTRLRQGGRIGPVAARRPTGVIRLRSPRRRTAWQADHQSPGNQGLGLGSGVGRPLGDGLVRGVGVGRGVEVGVAVGVAVGVSVGVGVGLAGGVAVGVGVGLGVTGGVGVGVPPPVGETRT